MTIAVLAILSILGIMGMTILFPLLGAIVTPWSTRPSESTDNPESIPILIPAHNEELPLHKTLTSISGAIEEVSKISQCVFPIVVGVDGCTDNTEAVARAQGARVVEMKTKTGKWGTIATLVASCPDSQWAILADCGVAWPKDFLVQLLPRLSDENTIAVAPTYRNNTSGILERLMWRTECVLKRIESLSGGPVSVHGATVCYRTKELTASLRLLSRHQWLNDDIVIPLCLRALYPSKRIDYAATLAVNESEKTRDTTTSEFRRRRRLVYGNIQWIRRLWGIVWRHNTVAAILAGRRVFRLLWAYWACFILLAVALHVGLHSFPASLLILSGVLCVVLVVNVRQLRTLLESALASLLVPYYFLALTLRAGTSREETQWN